jgi:hypothetical protein
MCYEIYIASDKPLKTIHWDEINRKLNVAKIDSKDKIIRKVFSKPHIYYIGSHLTGCCPNENLFERSLKRFLFINLGEVKEYIRQSLDRSKEIELYVSWEGGKKRSPENHPFNG